MATSQISTQLSADGAQLTIKPHGHFGFSMYDKFREACRQGRPGTRYVVDLADVSGMDSSALGMLLVLRDREGGQNGSIEIVHCSAEMRKILQIANFERLFSIS